MYKNYNVNARQCAKNNLLACLNFIDEHLQLALSEVSLLAFATPGLFPLSDCAEGNPTLFILIFMTPFYNAVFKSGVTISKLECGCNLTVLVEIKILEGGFLIPNPKPPSKQTFYT